MLIFRRLFGLLRLLIQGVYLALSQIWANKARSVLTTIGIIIGVASVTAVIAALTGLKANVLSEFTSFGTNKIFIAPNRPDEGLLRHISRHKLRFTPELFEGLHQHCPSIDQFTLMAPTGGSVHVGDYSIESVQITGINPSWHKIENRPLIEGRPFSVIDEQQGWQVCIITPEVRDKLHLDRECVGENIYLANRSFRIVGVIEPQASSKMFGGSGANSEIMVPFNTSWKIWEPYIFAIATSKSPEVSDEARAELTFFLRQARRLKPGQPDTFVLHVMEQYLKQFNQLAIAITLIAGGIVSISLLVGGVGIMNIMLVSVSERTREIGLRKAVGARPFAIMLQFLIEAVMLCFFGGLLGLLFGEMLTAIMAGIPEARLEKAFIPGWAVGLSFGFAALVGVFFGMFPAIKAARLDPIEALRHE